MLLSAIGAPLYSVFDGRHLPVEFAGGHVVAAGKGVFELFLQVFEAQPQIMLGRMVASPLAYVARLALNALYDGHEVFLEHVVARSAAQKSRALEIGIRGATYGAGARAPARGLAEEPRENVVIYRRAERAEHLGIAVLAEMIAELFAVYRLFVDNGRLIFFTALTEHVFSFAQLPSAPSARGNGYNCTL